MPSFPVGVPADLRRWGRRNARHPGGNSRLAHRSPAAQLDRAGIAAANHRAGARACDRTHRRPAAAAL